jgi:hypothetical protein
MDTNCPHVFIQNFYFISVINLTWRPEPVVVEKTLDELWIGVKSQSNSEIAGSPRTSFRTSVAC